MTKEQLIRLILDAAATGKLEDAEKAIDDFIISRIDKKVKEATNKHNLNGWEVYSKINSIILINQK